MNPAQIHLALNHAPVLGMIVAVVALASGLLFRAGALLRFGLFLLVGLALVAVPVYLSGNESEEPMERVVGVTRSTIHEHGEAAFYAMIGVQILGLVALVSLILTRRKPVPRGLGLGMLVAALFMSAVMVRTAHLGGLIRHPELRGELPTTSATPEGEDRSGRRGD